MEQAITEYLSYSDLQKLIASTFVSEWEGSRLLRIRGSESPDLLHRLSTNAILGARMGETRGTCFLTDKGRLVDYVNSLAESDDSLLLVTSGSADRLASWLERFIIMEDVTLHVCVSDIMGFSVVGPSAGEVVARVLDCNPGAWQNLRTVVGGDEVIVSRRGFREVDCYDILAGRSFSTLLGSFLEHVAPLASDSAELLRIWKGIPGYPGEISEDFNPYEAGFSDFLNDRKGCYVGQEVVARLATYDKVQRSLVGIILAGRPAGTGELVFEGTPIGRITSMSPLPVSGRFPGLAVIRKTMLRPDLPVVADQSVQGVLVPLPFPPRETDFLPSMLAGNEPGAAR